MVIMKFNYLFGGINMQNEIYTDHPTINWTLDHCKILHLGLSNDQGTFVVPVNYGYEVAADGTYIIYVHGTSNGDKGKALNEQSLISFEADGGHEALTYTPPAEGAFGPAFRSIMGHGKVEKIDNNNEKVHALRTILHSYVRDIPVALHAETMTNVPVWKIRVTDITAKIHHPTPEWQEFLNIKAPVSKGIHYDTDGGIISVDEQNFDDSLDDVASASKHEED